MKAKVTRRKLLQGAAGAVTLGSAAVKNAWPAVVAPLDLTVKKIDKTWINVPFRPVPARNMIRELPHWTVFVIYKVTLACGVVGFGETMQFYTWGTVSDEAIARVMNRKAADFLWDDSLGCGLQQALFDAVGKANGVPVHRLLGNQVRERGFISWWAIDQPAEDWVLECKDAVAAGFTAFKTKARPWFDLKDQCDKLMPTLPDYMRVNFDFNGTLMDSAHAGRYCVEIEKYPQVAMYETPIPQSDVVGNKQLRSQTRVAIAMHCATARANARWPQVCCHRIYTHQMIKQPIVVENWSAKVPEAPGLGVELDEDAVERFRIQPIAKPYPAPGLLIAIRWPSGSTSYYAHAGQYWDAVHNGRLPVFPRHVYLERIADNGSREWKEFQARAKSG